MEIQTQSYIKWNSINADEFEQLCQMVLGSFGFTNLVNLGGPGDRGRDIVCDLTTHLLGTLLISSKWIVQCKHYTHSPPKNMLLEDLAKAFPHNPDYWLLMTSATLSPSTHDWLVEVNSNRRYPFKIMIQDGTEIARIILDRPYLAGMFRHNLFVDDRQEASKIMQLMQQAKYDEALNKIINLSGEITPRIRYLEACSRSMLAASPSNKAENIEKAFVALNNAFDSGYVSQMHVLIGWPEEKIIYEVQRDPELAALKDNDLVRFKRIIGILKGDGTERHVGGGCLAADTPIRLIDESYKPISSIRIGDIVSTPNGSSKGGTVTNVFSVNDDCLVFINNSIFCSLTQPLMTTQGWKQALGLHHGDILMRSKTLEPILNLQYEKKTVTLYMISLSDEHSFFAADYIVHNKMILDDVDLWKDIF